MLVDRHRILIPGKKDSKHEQNTATNVNQIRDFYRHCQCHHAIFNNIHGLILLASMPLVFLGINGKPLFGDRVIH